MPSINDYGVTRPAYDTIMAQFADALKLRDEKAEATGNNSIHAENRGIEFPMEKERIYNVQMFVNVNGAQMIVCKIKARDMLNVYTTIYTAWENFIRHMETTAYYLMGKEEFDGNMTYQENYTTVRNSEPLMIIISNPDFIEGDAHAINAAGIDEGLAKDFQDYLEKFNTEPDTKPVSKSVLGEEE
tara:strand:+ start:664 stop:1221 length:558 start_codon:yes stop_codon:yes gene_type:complete